MKACLLIRTEPGKHNDVAEAVAGMEGVKLAFPVLGRTDVAANVEVADIESLSSRPTTTTSSRTSQERSRGSKG
jgi:DNA-binding Lrp family transcriptional regulator